MKNNDKSFWDRNTEEIFGGERVREFTGINKAAERKLEILDNTVKLVDLLVSPENRLEKLRGHRKGSHRI